MTHGERRTVVDVEGLRQLGGVLAASLTPGMVLTLEGPLGAGKTTLVRAIASHCGVSSESVSSPTFSLVNVYRGRELTVYHLDLYRVESDRELDGLDVEELLSDPGAVVLVEWPRRLLRRLSAWTEVVLDFVPDASHLRSVQTAVRAHGDAS